MEKLKQYALNNYIPIVRDNTAQCLIMKCNEIKPKKILEIGTAIGYSALLMLKSCDGEVYTIEKNQERFNEAKENFKKFCVQNRVRMFLGDAIEVLEKLEKAGEKFDLIFLDGPKGQYIKYFPFIKAMLNQKGVLFADNILVHGLVKDEEKVTHKNRTMVRNMKAFVDNLLNDTDFETKIYEIDDGYSISIKK